MLKRLVGSIARLGGWTIALPSRALSWSPENCLIHDVPVDYQPTLEEGIGCFLPEHRSLVAGYVEACIAHGTPDDFVSPKHTAKHRLIWVRSIGKARRNEAGQIVVLQGTFQHVTKQKCAELRTQAQLRLLQTAVARLNNTVVITGINAPPAVPLPVVFVNEAFERRTGYPQNALSGKGFAGCCGWGFRPLNGRASARPSRNGQPIRTEIALTSKAGAAL